MSDDFGKLFAPVPKRRGATYFPAQQPLEVTAYHKADATMVLDISGRKCQACGLVVSEEGRKKEKLGGPAGKSIGKTPCPKCKQKFGDVSLFDFKVKEEAAEPDAAMAETGGLKSK